MAVDVQSPDIRQQGEAPAGARLRDERSIGDLIKELRDETTTLMRQEIALAKAETMEKARAATRNGMTAGIGGGIAFAGFLFVLLGASFIITNILVAAGVGPFVSLWLGPLIVGVVVVIVGLILLSKGLNGLSKNSIVPQQTLKTLQEDGQWVRAKLK